jgi:hypothetical protein
MRVCIRDPSISISWEYRPHHEIISSTPVLYFVFRKDQPSSASAHFGE